MRGVAASSVLRWTFIAFVTLVLLAWIATSSAWNPAPALTSGHRDVHITTSFAKSDLATLKKRAKAVAIVEPAASSDHWNNASNTEWGEVGVDAFIYRDTTLRVTRVIRGDLDAEI